MADQEPDGQTSAAEVEQVMSDIDQRIAGIGQRIAGLKSQRSALLAAREALIGSQNGKPARRKTVKPVMMVLRGAPVPLDHNWQIAHRVAEHLLRIHPESQALLLTDLQSIDLHQRETGVHADRPAGKQHVEIVGSGGLVYHKNASAEAHKHRAAEMLARFGWNAETDLEILWDGSELGDKPAARIDSSA